MRSRDVLIDLESLQPSGLGLIRTVLEREDPCLRVKSMGFAWWMGEGSKRLTCRVKSLQGLIHPTLPMESDTQIRKHQGKKRVYLVLHAKVGRSKIRVLRIREPPLLQVRVAKIVQDVRLLHRGSIFLSQPESLRLAHFCFLLPASGSGKGTRQKERGTCLGWGEAPTSNLSLKLGLDFLWGQVELHTECKF